MAQPATCQNCNTAQATLKCTTCPASLCQACKDNTHSAPLFKTHVVTLLTAASADQPATPASPSGEKDKKEKKEKKSKKEEKPKKEKKAKEEKKDKKSKGIYGKVVDGLHYVGNLGAHPAAESDASKSGASSASDASKADEKVASPRPKSVKGGLFGLGKSKDDKKDAPADAPAASAAPPAAAAASPAPPQAAVSPRTQQANANAAQEAKLRELALREAEERSRREEADRVIREAEERAAAEMAEKARVDELAATARAKEREREAEQAREAEAKAKERAAYEQVLTKAESEARAYLEAVLGEQLPPGELSEALRSGVVLCRALNVLRPNSVARVDTSGQAFKQRENIGAYLEACRAAGLKDEFLFVTADLFDAKNVPQVLRHVIALKRHFGEPAAAPAAPASGALSPRARVNKPLPPPPGGSPHPNAAVSVAVTPAAPVPASPSEDKAPSWLNHVPPPAIPEPEPAPAPVAVPEPAPAPAPAPAPVVVAAAPAPVSVTVSAPAPAAKSVQVQEPARPSRAFGASDQVDDAGRESERLERTMARKSGKGITFSPTVKAEAPAAAAASPAAASEGAEPTAAQAGDFAWWNAKTFAELRKECERRGVKATAGGKEGFVKALMAHYGHGPAPAPTPAPAAPAPAPTPAPAAPAASASASASGSAVSLGASVKKNTGGGSGSVVGEHNVSVPHDDVDEDLREQQRLDRAVSRKSGKFRAN